MTDSTQTKAETPSELGDEELVQAQGGRAIKRSGQGDPTKRARGTIQDTIAIGDTLVSVEAD